MPSFIGYVPTPQECVNVFFDLVEVSPYDVVYDLGSGDGRLLFAALDKGAGRVVGVDLNPELVERARETARLKGMADRATFIQADVLDVDLSEATLVLCYLFPSASEALRPKFETELKKDARIVMESFHIPGWKENKTLFKEGKDFYLYVIPAQVNELANG